MYKIEKCIECGRDPLDCGPLNGEQQCNVCQNREYGIIKENSSAVILKWVIPAIIVLVIIAVVIELMK